MQKCVACYCQNEFLNYSYIFPLLSCVILHTLFTFKSYYSLITNSSALFVHHSPLSLTIGLKDSRILE